MLSAYFSFEGRARRRTYVALVLPLSLLSFPVFLMLQEAAETGSAAGGGARGLAVLALFVGLGLTLPVTVRRLHDLDLSAWWLLVGLVPVLGGLLGLTLLFKRGTWGENRFGLDPLDPDAIADGDFDSDDFDPDDVDPDDPGSFDAGGPPPLAPT